MGQFKTKEKMLTNSENKKVSIKVTLFTGSYGIELLSRIISKISPTLLNSIDAKGKKLSEVNINFKEISNNIVSGFSDGSILNLIKEIVSSSNLDNTDLSSDGGFDMVFCGEYGLLIDSITFILEANYKSFLAGNAMKALKKKIKMMIPKILEMLEKFSPESMKN